jgi:hypothetical protein
MFGLGRRTLHNEAVRKALQLPAKRLGLGFATPLPSHALLRDIKDMMMPEAVGYVRAELYALNVYSPDGEIRACILQHTPSSAEQHEASSNEVDAMMHEVELAARHFMRPGHSRKLCRLRLRSCAALLR